jgi:hypothetical protein
VRRRARREVEVFSLSFLDCICCGFGAMILLLVLVRIGEPRAVEAAEVELNGRLARLEEQLALMRGESEVLVRELRGRQVQLSEEQAAVARLQGDLSNIQGQFAASQQLSQVQEKIEGRLVAAQQELSEEMKRLQAQAAERPRRAPDAPVGGIPIDSEYVIYPKVKGLQVLNDEGGFMFTSYAGKWIPDTPARRQAVLDRLRSWNAFSNSSPVEGIEAAIRAFATPDKRVSVYVLGDEFTGDSIQDVVETVDRINARSGGRRRVRVHAIGFPTMFSQSEWPEDTGIRFATLMRALCDRNGGAFVGLASLRP